TQPVAASLIVPSPACARYALLRRIRRPSSAARRPPPRRRDRLLTRSAGSPGRGGAGFMALSLLCHEPGRSWSNLDLDFAPAYVTGHDLPHTILISKQLPRVYGAQRRGTECWEVLWRTTVRPRMGARGRICRGNSQTTCDRTSTRWRTT